MVNRCVVFGCSNEPKKGVTLHEFPSGKRERDTWTRFVKRTRKNWDGPTSNTRICSEHFSSDLFENKMKFDLGHAKILRLHKHAVPTIYPTGTCKTGRNDGASVDAPSMTSAMRKREALQVITNFM